MRLTRKFAVHLAHPLMILADVTGLGILHWRANFLQNPQVWTPTRLIGVPKFHLSSDVFWQFHLKCILIVFPDVVWHVFWYLDATFTFDAHSEIIVLDVILPFIPPNDIMTQEHSTSILTMLAGMHSAFWNTPLDMYSNILCDIFRRVYQDVLLNLNDTSNIYSGRLSDMYPYTVVWHIFWHVHLTYMFACDLTFTQTLSLTLRSDIICCDILAQHLVWPCSLTHQGHVHLTHVLASCLTCSSRI